MWSHVDLFEPTQVVQNPIFIILKIYWSHFSVFGTGGITPILATLMLWNILQIWKKKVSSVFTSVLWWSHISPHSLIWSNYFSERCAGKIKTVALTNFDTERLQIILENEIPVVSNQVNLNYVIIFYNSFRTANMLSILLLMGHNCDSSGTTFNRWHAPPTENGRALSAYGS